MFCGVFHFLFFKALSMAEYLIEPMGSKAAYRSLLEKNSSPNYEGHLEKWMELTCTFTCMYFYTPAHIFMYIHTCACMSTAVHVRRCVRSHLNYPETTKLPVLNGAQMLR